MKPFEILTKETPIPIIYIKELSGKSLDCNKNFPKEMIKSIIVLNCTLDFAEELITSMKIAIMNFKCIKISIMIMGFNSEKEECIIALSPGYSWKNTLKGLIIYKSE